MPEPVPSSPEEDLMKYIANTLADAKRYGMECEVLAWAFMDLCDDHARIKGALDHGCREWDL